MTIIVRAFATASEVYIFASICTNNACSWMFCLVLCSEVRFFYFTPYDTSIFERRFTHDSSPKYLYVIFENAFFDSNVSFNNDIISYYGVCDETKRANSDIFSEGTIDHKSCFMDRIILVHERILVKKFFYPLCHLVPIVTNGVSLDAIKLSSESIIRRIETIHTCDRISLVYTYLIFFWHTTSIMSEYRSEIRYLSPSREFTQICAQTVSITVSWWKICCIGYKYFFCF